MKKHKKHFKHSSDTGSMVLPTKSTSSSHLVQVLVALVVIGVISFIVYGFHCVTEKTCTADITRRLTVKTTTVTTPKGVVTAEIVDTAPSRELGLSGRTGIGEHEGMLFIFDKPGRYGFWMKDMLFSVDMVWISDDGLVVHVKKHATPESFPEAFTNVLDAKYVIELHDGQAEKLGLYTGAQVKIGSK